MIEQNGKGKKSEGEGDWHATTGGAPVARPGMRQDEAQGRGFVPGEALDGRWLELQAAVGAPEEAIHGGAAVEVPDRAREDA